MARTAVTIGFSVPPETAELVERIATREGRSKSELFRDMVRVYSIQRELEVFEEFAASGAAKAAEAAATTASTVAPELLSVSERVQIAEDLWDSLAPTLANAPVTSAEVEVLDARLEDVEQEPTAEATWEDAQARVRNQLTRRRQ